MPVTIYVVEDHVVIRELLISQLDSMPGYHVVGYSADGATACREVPQLNPNLLLLDLELPDITGIEVAYRVMETVPDTRILVFTGAAQPSLLQAAVAAKVHGIARKAAPLPTLLEAIDAVAHGRTYYDELLVGEMRDWAAAAKGHASLHDLTLREQEVFRLVANGRSNKEVANDLGISIKTAENHRKNLMQKLGAKNATDLTREAFRLGVLK
ncbi:LuxR C-terminal-related transcriptional regulator [Oleiharenicola lentus]|uniref:LuxR C-terminal-related transcriptional regulator n=1 Tax=Oleiharenicola lentus TaxID=2508720 RepID=UPI003F67B50D